MWKKEPPNDWLLNLNDHLPYSNHKEKTVWVDAATAAIKAMAHTHTQKFTGFYHGEFAEDAVLTYLFDYIDDEHKFAVDLGAGNGFDGSNVRYLCDNYGWNSIEVDYMKGKSLKWKNTDELKHVQNRWIKPSNVCRILEEYHPIDNLYQSDLNTFDLLSIDLDSMDWYVLRALLRGGYKPNVTILEFNPVFDYNTALVRKYSAKYKKDSTSNYGASLKAYEILMNEMDYTLVHVFADPEIELFSNNAIFLHNKFITEEMKIKTIEELHPKPWKEPWKRRGGREFLEEYSFRKREGLKSSVVDLTVFCDVKDIPE